MKREGLVAAPLLGCMGIGIAAIEVIDLVPNSRETKIFSRSMFVGAFLVVVLFLYISYAKRSRSVDHGCQVEGETKRVGRWSAFGAAFSGVITITFTALTGVSSAAFITALGGVISGFMISLSLAVVCKYLSEKFNSSGS
ncbi:hypothetical protein [Rugamonas aquatica]|uniref:Uncharacterized protein n=1 Tax=Rugamonas aquatica TaxID=2743357 RepID=A0A6A7N624_9BURK|nr:hypothetical protein [Rugamonas aquatica]MQA40348.1 hypothetical protein [Rugamonas aquatica]